MKKVLIDIVLCVVLLVSIVVNIFLLMKEKDDNKYNLYECSFIELEENYEKSKVSTIDYDDIGRIVYENISYIEKFNDPEEYKMIKESRKNVKENNYEYIDDKNSIVEKYEFDYTVDNNNDEQYIWVKHVIDEYVKNGYTCKVITNEE